MKPESLKPKVLIAPLAAFVAFCLSAPFAAAVEDVNEKSGQQLDPVKVVAKNVPDDVDLEAIAVDSEEIEKKQIWGLNDLFLSTPGVEVGGGAPNARRLYLRGISDSLLTITVDGARQNKDLRCSRGTMVNMDVDLLKFVEVDAGPTSADQGSANLGGSIRYTTKDAQDLLRDGQKVGVLAKTSYSSVSEGWRNSLAAYGAQNDIGMLLYVTDTDTENYETGSGEEALGTAEEQRDYFAKLSVLNKAGNDLRISAEKNTQEGLFPWTKPGDQGKLTDESLASRQELEQETLTLNHQFTAGSPYINTDLNIYSVDTSVENKDINTKYSSDGVGGSFKNTFKLAWGETKNDLSVGADYIDEDGKSTTGTFSSSNLGFFVQDRLSYGIFNLSFGVRYDSFEDEFVTNDVDNDAVSPNIKGSVNVGHGFSLFAGYGETVSGANTIPLNWVTNLAANCTFNGEKNGSLDPEKSKKAEIGAGYEKTGLLMSNDTLSLKATLFDTVIEDSIIAGTGGSGNTVIRDIVNDENDLETKGFEITAQWGVAQWNLFLAYAHNDIDYGDEAVSKTIRRTAASTGDTISFALNYVPCRQFDIGYTMLVVFDNPDAPDGGYLEDGYVLHNLSMQYHPQMQYLRNFTLSLAVNNIFDEEYANQTTVANFGAPVDEPGRDIRVSLSYRF